ncbi:hypothetical protein BKA69DRAFT_758991 [Paraphysoderma sedebokerense]|nr:hypothetical protein BKA69DRAFT_758991 [Paraphysoderma sedebokerense]
MRLHNIATVIYSLALTILLLSRQSLGQCHSALTVAWNSNEPRGEITISHDSYLEGVNLEHRETATFFANTSYFGGTTVTITNYKLGNVLYNYTSNCHGFIVRSEPSTVQVWPGANQKILLRPKKQQWLNAF